jgi:hypothetical protein
LQIRSRRRVFGHSRSRRARRSLGGTLRDCRCVAPRVNSSNGWRRVLGDRRWQTWGFRGRIHRLGCDRRLHGLGRGWAVRTSWRTRSRSLSRRAKGRGIGVALRDRSCGTSRLNCRNRPGRILGKGLMQNWSRRGSAHRWRVGCGSSWERPTRLHCNASRRSGPIRGGGGIEASGRAANHWRHVSCPRGPCVGERRSFLQTPAIRMRCSRRRRTRGG